MIQVGLRPTIDIIDYVVYNIYGPTYGRTYIYIATLRENKIRNSDITPIQALETASIVIWHDDIFILQQYIVRIISQVMPTM